MSETSKRASLRIRLAKVWAPIGATGGTKMTEVAPEENVAESGYEPELKRSLSQFQVFALSFAFISVAGGVFGPYDDVLQNAGPVGIWVWVVVAIGQTLVALVIAQFAARI